MLNNRDIVFLKLLKRTPLSGKVGDRRSEFIITLSSLLLLLIPEGEFLLLSILIGSFFIKLLKLSLRNSLACAFFLLIITIIARMMTIHPITILLIIILNIGILLFEVESSLYGLESSSLSSSKFKSLFFSI